MKKIYLFIGIFLISLTVVSALTVKYFYSPTCQYCQQVSPLIQELMQEFKEVNWEVYNINEVPNNYTQSVPAIVIDEEMIIVGAKDIPERLRCEVQQMSTPDCITKSADSCVGSGESWFVD